MRERGAAIRGIVPLVLCASAAARMPLAEKAAFANHAISCSSGTRAGNGYRVWRRALVHGRGNGSGGGANQNIGVGALRFSSSSVEDASDEELDEAVRAAVASLPTRPRVAVVGAGFAGLATAYHLAAFGSDVTVFDPHDAGTGTSASSVAAGLLHPLTPRGKLIWKGEEGFKAAKHLIETVNTQLEDDAAAAGTDLSAKSDGPRGCVTTDRVYRPLTDEKQLKLFNKAAEDLPQWVESLTREELMEAVPGSTGECLGGVRIRGALAVDAPAYLKGLWAACRGLLNTVGPSTSGGGDDSGVSGSDKEGAMWMRQKVDDIHALAASGEFSAVVACVGAGVRVLAGVKEIVSLRLVRGQSLLYDNVQPTGEEEGGGGREGTGAPAGEGGDTSSNRLLQSAVLCGQYVVPGTVGEVGPSGGEGGKIILGSTQEHLMFGAELDKPPDMAKALRQLRPKVATFFPALLGVEPSGVTSGVRVIQDRSNYGRMPIAGRLPFTERGWVIAALGARGLIHHAYLGKRIAACALLDSDEPLPPQVMSPLEDLGKEAKGDL